MSVVLMPTLSGLCDLGRSRTRSPPGWRNGKHPLTAQVIRRCQRLDEADSSGVLDLIHVACFVDTGRRAPCSWAPQAPHAPSAAVEATPAAGAGPAPAVPPPAQRAAAHGTPGTGTGTGVQPAARLPPEERRRRRGRWTPRCPAWEWDAPARKEGQGGRLRWVAGCGRGRE